MGKIKETLFHLPLKAALAIYLALFMILATFLSALFLKIFENAQSALFFKYYEQLRLYESPANSLSITMVLRDGIYSLYSRSDLILSRTLEILSVLTVPLLYISCAAGSIFFFYRRKMKTPVELLDEASSNILSGNLDFAIRYDSRDEMGKLCASFEKMRASLFDSNRELWRALEERKRLNAAFSHDLRTPLTVLRGYTDLLVKYIPEDKFSKEKLLETVNTMSGQIGRLENYVFSMNALQKLDDIVPSPQPVPGGALLDELTGVVRLLCLQNGLAYSMNGSLPKSLNVDGEIVLQVFENLVSNATRFAKEKITVLCTADGGKLILDILDDGEGFSEKDLLFATRPYYGKDKDGKEGHFGLGLNICKILCEKHGGGLTLGNDIHGGAHVSAEFSCAIPG